MGGSSAEFLPRHMPGNPTIVPQNMPGAGSFAAAYYMADAAPKDGTVLGVLTQTLRARQPGQASMRGSTSRAFTISAAR